MLRAAPKNALGLCNEAGSSPPDSVRPLGGMTRYMLVPNVLWSP